jgi:hypothetical protein
MVRGGRKGIVGRHTQVNATPAGRCSVIGLRPEELEWVRLVVTLLRHPDPLTAELARQALEYVRTVAFSGRRKQPVNG